MEIEPGAAYAPPMETDRVVVLGRARRQAPPDAAVLQMQVVEVDQDQRAAFARCGPRVDAVVSELRRLVGADGVVTTGVLHVERYYDDAVEDDGQSPRLHAARCPVAVQCGPDRAAEVASTAMEAGVDQLDGPRLFLRDSSALVEQLLEEAVAAARRKAERLARAADRRLGLPVAIEERGSRGWSEDDFEDGGVIYRASSAGPDLQPAQLTLTATVRVAYALSEATAP